MNRLYKEMKKNDNFRKFFTLITLLMMILVQFVDYSSSGEVARIIRDAAYGGTETAAKAVADTCHMIAVYGSLMSKPHDTLLAACLSLTLFVFKAGDWLLTRLHNSRKIFLQLQ